MRLARCPSSHLHEAPKIPAPPWLSTFSELESYVLTCLLPMRPHSGPTN
jgi:hypothetical protein